MRAVARLGGRPIVKCPKCSLVTFDHLSKCPRCRTSFELTRRLTHRAREHTIRLAADPKSKPPSRTTRRARPIAPPEIAPPEIAPPELPVAQVASQHVHASKRPGPTFEPDSAAPESDPVSESTRAGQHDTAQQLADGQRLKQRMVLASQARRRRRTDGASTAVDPLLPDWYEPATDTDAATTLSTNGSAERRSG